MSESPVNFIVSLDKTSKRLLTEKSAHFPDTIETFEKKTSDALADFSLEAMITIQTAHLDTRQKKSGVRTEKKSLRTYTNEGTGELADCYGGSA